MKQTSPIDMLKPSLLYVASIILLAGLSMWLKRIEYALPIEFEHAKQVSIWLFSLGGAIGLFAIAKHMKRLEQPHAVPLAQVSAPFFLFVIVALAAVVIGA